MIFCNLGSGSKGNCTFVRQHQKGILIDQGFSLKNLLMRMAQAGVTPENVGAIIVTHEHSDHIKGIGVFARHFHIPVYLTERTFSGVDAQLLHKVAVHTFTTGDILPIDDLKIKTFHIPHDALDPIGVTIESAGQRLAVITDLGSVTESVLQQIANLDLLLLEANHDLTMLINGPYPLPTKQRIKSRVGHLSNEQSLELFSRLNLNGRLQYLVLGHLSEINNHPEIVLDTFNRFAPARQFQIEIANQYQPTRVIEF